MKKILLIDLNNSFTSDIERNIIINEYDDVEIITRGNIDEALMQIGTINPDAIVVSCAVIMSANWNDYGVPVYSYAKTNNELLVSHNAGIPCYGILKKASELIEAIRNNTTLNIYSEQNNTQENNSQEDNFTDTSYVYTQEQHIQPTESFLDYSQQQNNYNYNSQNYYENYQDYYNGYAQNQAYTTNEAGYQQLTQQTDCQNQMNHEQQYPNYVPDTDNAYYQQYSAYLNSSNNNDEPQTEPLTSDMNCNVNSVTDNSIEYKSNKILTADMKNNVANRLKTREENGSKDIAQKEFMEDMGYSKKKAKCITVYSAKGGVGKTTISCELATFLSLTSHGRANFKVCIADFNIDFGDVLNTLSFDAGGANMTTWAADIRDRINSGEAPENINYPLARIRTWLQQNEKDNLFALLAPITNADSAEIGELEIEVMLRNLIENCDFDFVICDTGNNTRDSSFIALEMADVILLVLTQSVNTANCNNSFLATAQRIGFDMSKFKLIINKVKPAKLVGISTEELETAFINTETQKPYNFECLAKIKDNNDVASSNNLGEPLVYNSSHEFTKTIGEIVFKLIGKQTILKKPEKTSFLNKLFKKK